MRLNLDHYVACGSERLHEQGAAVSKTLECEPRRWKLIEHIREKFSCRDCEAITKAPASLHPIRRGFAGPSLLAILLVNKFLASAVEPPEQDLCPRSNRDRCLNWRIASVPGWWRSLQIVEAIRPMSCAPNASMSTTRRCLCWRN
ncbi:IS66 family transposase zinc-finger binding domain-containing protein [Bradyrhizobium sp. U531]